MEDAGNLSSQEKLITLIGEKAHNLFTSGRLLCSEAVLVTLNQGLKGGLSQEMAEALTAGMGGGLGGSGCLCGAVNGAVVALGLFLKGCEPSNRVTAKVVRAHTRKLEKAFTARFGATCCRILSKNDAAGNQTKRQRCADQTAFAAELAARIILSRRPDIKDQADHSYLEQRHSRASTYLKMIAGKH